MNHSAGLLIVKARFEKSCLNDIEVALTRPSVSRLFVGQEPDVVTKTVPYLFTLCAGAQQAAARAAVAAARSEVLPVADSRGLWIEVLHENLWRLLLDWPPALGLRPDKDAFVAWRNQRQGGEYLDATRAVLHDSLRPLAEKCLEMLVDRSTEEVAPDDGDLDVPMLGTLDPGAWLAYWQGTSAQMPALPLPGSIRSAFLARLAATLAAADALASRAPVPAASAGNNGWGIGQVMTARGVLTHAVHIADGKVVNYRVQAPTDSLFADASALSSLLANLRFASPDQARQAISLAVLAIDPCVPHVVELKDA